MLEHRARRDDQPRLAGPAHQLDRHDAVAPEREEVVVDADPLHPQHLGKQCAQHVLLRRARPAPHARREVRRRQRLAVELAVGGQRQPLQNHQCRRHHVVGEAATQMRPQCRRHPQPDRPPQPHRPPAACCPACPPAPSPPPAPRSHAAPAPPRSRQAQCGTRAASPGCRHAPESPKPRPPPARQIPSPVHPAPRRPKRIGHKPLRRQARATQIAPRQSRSRNIKLPNNTGRHRLQTPVQDINPRVPNRSPDRNRSAVEHLIQLHRPCSRRRSRLDHTR